MSKKNLSHTLIEGGRRGYNTYERRMETRVERHHVRWWLGKAALDGEVWEAKASPTRRRVRREFNDKLKPLKRWLFSQAGRHWDDVYAELHEKLDARTTAGRHLLYDHVPLYVDFAWHVSRYHRYYLSDGLLVGDDGVLRFTPGRARPRRGDWRPDLTKWASLAVGGRRIRIVGEEVFWFEPAWHQDAEYHRWVSGHRQGKHLSEGEYNWWARLTGFEREALE